MLKWAKYFSVQKYYFFLIKFFIFYLNFCDAGWRRSHRPSIRDISIIDEEEEREDPELSEDKETADNTQCNAHTQNLNYTSYNK